MRFCMNLGNFEVNKTVDAKERNSIIRGIIHAWRFKPEARKETIKQTGGPYKFPTKFQDHGLPGYYELNSYDLRTIFELLRGSRIGVDKDLSEDEKRESEAEQLEIYRLLNLTVKMELKKKCFALMAKK